MGEWSVEACKYRCTGAYAGARQYKDIVWYTVAHGREWDQV
jgi:hypothetical protein